jgi:hypothetical protein
MLNKIFLAVLFMPAIICAQTSSTMTAYMNSNLLNLERYRVNNGTPTQPEWENKYRYNTPTLTGHAYAGKQELVADAQNTFRMVYGTNLNSIPSGSILVSVKVIYSATFTSACSNKTFGFELKTYQTNPYSYSSDELRWNAVDNGDVLLSQSNIPSNIGAVLDHDLGTFGASTPIGQYVQSNFGKLCHFSVRSTDEDWPGSCSPYHVTDYKYTSAQETRLVTDAWSLEITYIKRYTATISNNRDFTDQAGDFVIDNTTETSPVDVFWYPSTQHDISMLSHSAVPVPEDENRPYALEPKHWQRIGGAQHPAADWNDIELTSDAGFKAHHYLRVDNQFKTFYHRSNVEMTDIPFTVSGQASYSSYIHNTRDGSQYAYNVIYPFAYLQFSSGRQYYLVNMEGDGFGAYVPETVSIVQYVEPTYHHKESSGGMSYRPPHKAYYQDFAFYEVESGVEVMSVPVSIVGINNTNHEFTYSVPLSYINNGVQYVFVGWDDSEVGILDYISGAAQRTIELGMDSYDYSTSMTGRYKAHLVSLSDFDYYSSRCATCPNSQRKIDWAVAQTGMPYSTEGLYQTVYESNDKIWYTESIDHANTWSPEILVGEGLRPSIASTSQKSYVTYWSGGGVTTKLYQNRNWTDITGVNNLDATDDAAPVISIDSLDNVVLVVYEGLSDDLIYVVYLDDQEVEYGTVPNVGQYGPPQRPSLGHSQGAQSHHLVWREADKIIYQRIKIDANGSIWHGATFYGSTDISNVNHEAKDAPSITIGKNGYPAVSWGSEDLVHGKFISFRQNSSTGWGTMATMIADPNDSYFAPSVASLSDQLIGDDLRIAHNGNYGMAVQRLASGSWKVPTVYQSYEGIHPNTVDIVPSAFSHEVFAEYTNLFQGNAKLVSFGNSYLDRANRSSLESSREIVFIKDTTRAQIRLGELEVVSGQGDVDLGWNTGFDTLVVGRTKTIEDYLRTANFAVPQNAVLKYRSTRKKNGLQSMPSNLMLSFEVVNANTNQVIATMQQVSVDGMNGNRVDGNYTLPLNSYSGENVYVRGRATGLDSTVSLLAVDYYHTPGTTLPKDPIVAEEAVIGETGFTLSENYPNPFNPTTTIVFTLHEASEVKLIVSDMYGRQISVLADGVYGAGSFSKEFDASDLPSGTYYYSLHTPNGTITRSMHLVK